MLIFSPDGYAYLFSWRCGEHILPFFEREAEDLPEGFSLDGDVLTANVNSGTVYKFKLKS